MTNFSEREVEIFLAGMKLARSLAIETGKGLTASNRITQELQHLSMRKEIVKHKGVWA